jgi:hypothetical protein
MPMPPLDDQARAIATAINGRRCAGGASLKRRACRLPQTDEALIRLRRAGPVTLTLAPCDACRRDTLLYRLGDSALAAHEVAADHADAILDAPQEAAMGTIEFRDLAMTISRRLWVS